MIIVTYYTQNIVQTIVGGSYHIKETKFHIQALTQILVFKKPIFLTFFFYNFICNSLNENVYLCTTLFIYTGASQ